MSEDAQGRSAQGQCTPAGPNILSIVVPVYNEADVLSTFHTRLVAVLTRLPVDAEILYVDDGSTDATAAVLTTLQQADARVSVIQLSRNFGKEIAMTAGLDHVLGDAAVIIDADLQDPPELIPEFVHHWRSGYDVVYGRRAAREGESILKRFTAYAFYRMIQRLSRVRIPEDAGDFRLISRRALESLRAVREQHRFMKGLFAWVGYRQMAVEYRRERRHAGRTKWNYWRLWNFALEGITSFSTAPLKVATYLGLLTSFTAFSLGGIVIFRTLVYGDPVRGYPSLMTVMLFFGGIQLISLGLLGEYVARIFDESKRRPLYIISNHVPAASVARSATSPVAPVPPAYRTSSMTQ